jgi:hypothetical protein
VKKRRLKSIVTFTILVLLALATPAMAREVKARYLYSRSTYFGPVPYSCVSLSVDKKTSKIYVISGSEMNIFNATTMRIYSFGNEESPGAIRPFLRPSCLLHSERSWALANAETSRAN